MHSYFQKHAFFKEPLIKDLPHPDLSLIVVIPAFKEENILEILHDLYNCDKTHGAVEVIVVINYPEGSSAEIVAVNNRAYQEAIDWSAGHSIENRRFFILYTPELPKKKAGVGLARKIGMDEAARRLSGVIYDRRIHPVRGGSELQRTDNRGIIVGLDADCRVQPNYLTEIEKFFSTHPRIEGCSIAFGHRLEGLTPHERQSILDYEQHLRYFVGIQRWAGCPFAFQTIGSSMAVRADVYCKVGGMNTRQAGEDFYFLHKVIKRGAFAELNTTTVYPSARISDRVPFGTGRAMMNMEQGGERLQTYHPQLFIDLKAFLDLVPELYQYSGDPYEFLKQKEIARYLFHFLEENQFGRRLYEIQRHTASPDAFVKRFFHWFDAFLVMKYVNGGREEYGSVEVGSELISRYFYRIPWI